MGEPSLQSMAKRLPANADDIAQHGIGSVVVKSISQAYPVALEISLTLRIWLTQRPHLLGTMRPICREQFLPTIPLLYPDTAIVIECQS